MSEFGFYNPTGVDPAFAKRVDFAMVEVINEAQVRTALAMAAETGLKLTLNIGPVITESRPIDAVNRSYEVDGQTRTKRFLPRPQHKLKQFVSETRLSAIIARLTLVMREYPNVIDTVFLIDEPYLKGVGPDQIDRIAQTIRASLKDDDVQVPKLGVVFASLMYDARFAEQLSLRASDYAAAADQRFDDERASFRGSLNAWFGWESRWIQGFANNRLVTYDQAGNLYTQGGLPKQVDVIGFNFYASTLLLDDLYREIPSWLSDTLAPRSCQSFREQSVDELRDQLSFFEPAPSAANFAQSDRQLLDRLFICRIQAVGKSLNNEMREANQAYEVVMIGESSSNGVMAFDAGRGVKDSQDYEAVERRVYEEVGRYLDPTVL